MRQPPDPVVDPRDAAAFVADLLARRAGYVPAWRPGDTGPDVAIAQALGRYLGAITARLNQVPGKHQLALLDTLGVTLVPAQHIKTPLNCNIQFGELTKEIILKIVSNLERNFIIGYDTIKVVK